MSVALVPVSASGTLLGLPSDLWEEVTLELGVRDIWSIRQTCWHLRDLLSEYGIDTTTYSFPVPTLRGQLHGTGIEHVFNGQTIEHHYRNGYMHGLAIWRDPAGTVVHTVPWKEGLLHGRSWDFDRGVTTLMYANGFRHGPARMWSEDGTLLQVTSHVHGRRHGPAKFWRMPLSSDVLIFGTGVSCVGQYKDDKAHGYLDVLDKSGKIVGSARYHNGKAVEGWAPTDNTLSREIIDRDVRLCTEMWW